MTGHAMQQHQTGKGLLAHLRRFWRNEQGGPLVEFAFLAPIFASMILASVELTNAMETARRGSTAANVLADLLSREVEIPSSGVNIATYFTRMNDAVDQILDLPDNMFSFHVAHIYHNDVGNYNPSHASSWQYASHQTGASGMSSPTCDGVSMAYSNFANGDEVHAVAPELREVQDITGDAPETVRNALLSQSGTVVVVRLRYCYQPLLFGVINDIVGQSEIVATFAPRNTVCIPRDNSTDGDGSSVSDCSGVDGYTSSTSGTSGSS